MNKALVLLLIIVSWVAAGFAIFGSGDARSANNAPAPGQVNRIISLAPSVTEILFALGLGEQTVGVTRFSDYPPAAKKKLRIGTFVQPDIEAVIGTRPDLIVTVGSQLQASFAGRLRRIGYNCLILDIDEVDDLFTAIERIGAATARQTRARELASEIRANLDKLSALVGGGEKPKVLWVVQREPLRIAGRETFVSEIIELAGGENMIGPTIHKYPPIGAEQVIAGRPDVIIEITMRPGNLEAEQAAALEYWGKTRFRNVPAVANDRIHVVPSATVSRLGPRLHQGVEMIARYLKPELFAN